MKFRIAFLVRLNRYKHNEITLEVFLFYIRISREEFQIRHSKCKHLL